LEVLSSSPLEANQSRPPEGSTTAGLILDAQSTFPDGHVVFLASHVTSGVRSRALITDIARTRPGDVVPQNLKGTLPVRDGGLFSPIFSKPAQAPYVSTLAAGLSGEIWLGGFNNTFRDIASAPHSDAYLAKVDATGKPIWEMAYGNGRERNIWSIAPLPGADVAVVGREGWGGRVDRIGPDGGQLWERVLGSDLGGAIASLPGDRLAIVGFEATGSAQNRDYQVHVAAWILDGSGRLLTQTRIRDSINKSQGSYFGNVSIITRHDAIYVTSNWAGLFDAQPVEIAKLSMDGTLLWTTLLSDTAVADDAAARSWKNCAPTLAVTPQGGVLVACSLSGQIQLYQIDQSSGASRESHLPLPDCQTGYPAALFLAIGKDGTMTLSGSRFNSSVAPSCSWIGRLTAIQ
jgi:hypothetical protein